MSNVPLSMNRKLSQDFRDFPGSANPEADLFGVEVELEGKNIIDRDGILRNNWIQHNDGSLRARQDDDQAIEYVTRAPYDLRTTQGAVKQLCQFLRGPNRVVNDSYRTSIHVHVNFLQDTLRTAVNFITISTIFDELMVSQNGQHRIGNNFCLRMRDAEGTLREVIESIGLHQHIVGIQPQNRYASINIASLIKFGTIEFRSLECTTDYDRIDHWIRTIQSMKDSSRKYENPREIIADFSRNGPAGFLLKTLGFDLAQKYVNVENMDRMLYDGMRLAQDFAYCSEWAVRGDAQMPKPKRMAPRPFEPHWDPPIEDDDELGNMMRLDIGGQNFEAEARAVADDGRVRDEDFRRQAEEIVRRQREAELNALNQWGARPLGPIPNAAWDPALQQVPAEPPRPPKPRRRRRPDGAPRRVLEPNL